jgi:hypothetical protein
MARSAVNGLVSLLALVAASMSVITSAGPGTGVEAVPAVHGPQIMLYVNAPLGSNGAGSLHWFGLKIEQLRTPPTSPQLSAAPIDRSTLVDLQLPAHSGLRVEFGRRLVWDIKRGTLASRSNTQGPTIGVPSRGQKLPDVDSQQTEEPAYAAILPRQIGGRSAAITNASSLSQWPATAGWAAGERLGNLLRYRAVSGP